MEVYSIKNEVPSKFKNTLVRTLRSTETYVVLTPRPTRPLPPDDTTLLTLCPSGRVSEHGTLNRLQVVGPVREGR